MPWRCPGGLATATITATWQGAKPWVLLYVRSSDDMLRAVDGGITVDPDGPGFSMVTLRAQATHLSRVC